MQGKNWPISMGATQGPGTPNHHANSLRDRHPASTQQTGTLTSGLHCREGGRLGRGSRVTCPKVSGCPGLLRVRGRQPAADRARTTDQTTRLKDMALDRVPQRVGVVGYGRLGESPTIWALPQVPSWIPQSPVSATSAPFSHLCVCALAGWLPE